ncbi:MAG: transporter substrate-binding domain-containing protein, partial [Chlamydiia bacterium]
RMGTVTGYAPFVSLNDQGDYEGFDIDIAHLLAERMDADLELEDMGSMPALMMALRQGKVDALIWAISITPSRQREMLMVRYQGEAETIYPLVFWKVIPDGVSSLGDLQLSEESPILVEGGSVQEVFLEQQSPAIPMRRVDTATQGMLEIRYGKAAAFLADPALLGKIRSSYPDARILEIPIPEENQSLGHGICIRPDNSALAKKIEAVVETLRCEGKIAELERRWGIAVP